MDRRTFLKDSAGCPFAIGAALPVAAATGQTGKDETRVERKFRKCRITVIETTFNEKIAKEYGAPNLGPCPFHKKGDTFVTDFGKPAGLCDEAWTAFSKYVFALSLGAEGFWPQWIEKPGISINSCNDGLRPTIFKLEAIEG